MGVLTLERDACDEDRERRRIAHEGKMERGTMLEGSERGERGKWHSLVLFVSEVASGHRLTSAAPYCGRAREERGNRKQRNSSVSHPILC